jgi:acetylornithine deacetylase
VGTIHGGVSVNTVPDRCTIEIDRRLPPGETPETAERHLRNYLQHEAGLDFAVQLDPPFMSGLALSDDANGPLAGRVAAIAQQATGRCNQTAVAYATNAAFYAAAGVPSVVFGPGSVDQAHTKDEWLPLAQLHQATQIYHQVVLWLESTL